MAKTFCFLSKKGGVGKTTFTLNCAHALAFSRFRTLLIDMDGQANLTKHLLSRSDLAENAMENSKEVEVGNENVTGTTKVTSLPNISQVLLRRTPALEAILTTGYENLDLLAGSTTLDDLPIMDPRLIREPTRFKNILQEVSAEYDFILVDCPPSVNWLTRMVLFATDKVIVPIQAEPYALQGLRDLIPILDKMSTTAQLHKIVINMFRANTQLHQGLLKEILAEFSPRVAKQTVRQTIQLAEAAKAGLSIFEYAPASVGALDLYALCWELFELSPDKVKILARDRNVNSVAPETSAPTEISVATEASEELVTSDRIEIESEN